MTPRLQPWFFFKGEGKTTWLGGNSRIGKRPAKALPLAAVTVSDIERWLGTTILQHGGVCSQRENLEAIRRCNIHDYLYTTISIGFDDVLLQRSAKFSMLPMRSYFILVLYMFLDFLFTSEGESCSSNSNPGINLRLRTTLSYTFADGSWQLAIGSLTHTWCPVRNSEQCNHKTNHAPKVIQYNSAHDGWQISALCTYSYHAIRMLSHRRVGELP